MERVECKGHGLPCLLKTGTREGPTCGQSFFICSQKQQPCDFVRPAQVELSHCLHHEGTMVELQAIYDDAAHKCTRLFFRCCQGKLNGSTWCGSVPWKDAKKERSMPLQPVDRHTLDPTRHNPLNVISGNVCTSNGNPQRCGGKKVQDENVVLLSKQNNLAKHVEDKGFQSDCRQEQILCHMDGGKTDVLKRGSAVALFKGQAPNTRKPELGSGSDIQKRGEADKMCLIQKKVTSCPGFSIVEERNCIVSQLQRKMATLAATNVQYLPDNGDRLRTQIDELNQQLQTLDLQRKVLRNANAASQDVKAPHQTKMQPSGASIQMASGRPTGAMLIPALPSTIHDGHGKCSAIKHALGTKDFQEKDFSRDVIERLHHCLETQPPSSQQATDPPGLRVSLLPHQREALAWMLWREQQLPCGGILADDMGLGKTLTMIALLLSKRACARQEEPSAKHESSELVGGTLVVCPASLLHHWHKEIERRTRPHLMTVVLYHGPQRTKDAKRLTKSDVVLTTYKIVALEAHGEDCENTEKTPSSLVCVRWTRLVLDEAHCIKNPKAQVTMAICRLRADARWAVTGTPVQNNLMDLYSIFRFLRCAPFDDLQVWKSKVDSGTPKARERLGILVRSLLLHRTKDHLVNLPGRHVHTHALCLSVEEHDVYSTLFMQLKSKLQSYLKRKEEKHEGSVEVKSEVHRSTTFHILSLLLRLRQCCCHPALLSTALQKCDLESDGIDVSLDEQMRSLSLSPSSSLAAPTASEEKGRISLAGKVFNGALFSKTWESSKISALLVELRAVLDHDSSPPEKCVVVSQWSSMLQVVAKHLELLRWKYLIIDGSVSLRRRLECVDNFNLVASGPRVLLLSLCAGGVGLNLVGGNHLFLMDMHWNPALEDQACDRIYRLGQLRNVNIHKFVCKDTVEEKILQLQGSKKELARHVLSGTAHKGNGLTLADIRLLFDV
uniref:transcription termination factor 2 n=1 Tax=Myxine glutinosa TaxID=7769 RepID=UPI0035900606